MGLVQAPGTYTVNKESKQIVEKEQIHTTSCCTAHLPKEPCSKAFLYWVRRSIPDTILAVRDDARDRIPMAPWLLLQKLTPQQRRRQQNGCSLMKG